MANLQLRLAHLYPKELNIYGDYGNVLTIQKRCEWRGIDIIIDEIKVGDSIKEHDLYFIGGGQDAQQIEVSKELLKNKEVLHKEKNADAVFLGICGGYQLMGNYYQPLDAERLEGIGLLDVYTIAGSARFIGNVTSKTNFIPKNNTLVGFENHSGLTYIQGDTKPVSEVIVGKGNNGKDKTEGARSNNVFGTYLHGPLLPKNPHFADYLISLALKKRYGVDIELAFLDDTLECYAHSKLIEKTY